MNARNPYRRDAHLRRWSLMSLGAVATIILLILIPVPETDRGSGESFGIKAKATFVGSIRCRECHESEYERWKRSDHMHAMAEATRQSVKGDFDDVTYDDGLVRVRFFRDGEHFMVNALGPDGSYHDYRVAYTFGWDPLQQYLIPLDGGRFQCLTIAWDVERRRWFNLYPDRDILPDDWLHWTRGGQNWNGMCAECHSTDLRKGYDPETRTFDTKWSEISVGCEACHGPGSEHIRWGRVPAMGREGDNHKGLVVRTSGISSRRLVQMCAPCHSRRSAIDDNRHSAAHLFDIVVPMLLEEGLYYADGQILAEDYVYGSFLQSKMYNKGVGCSDCHDAHTLEPRFDGNALCRRCHRGDEYDGAVHHFHKPNHEGAPSRAVLCTSCHMPERLYMGVDLRADHSIRIPRPDLSARIGVPNACSQVGCHSDRPLQWVLDAYTKWYGASSKPHYGPVIAAGRRRDPDAGAQLARISGDLIYPSIVRATALTLLASYPSEESERVFDAALRDEDPLVRYAAAGSIGTAEMERFAPLVAALLSDPVKAVRTQAALRLAAVPRGLLEPYQISALVRGISEYEKSLTRNLDTPDAGANLGNLYAALGERRAAEEFYRRSLEVDGAFLPSLVGLARLLSLEGKKDGARGLLARAARAYPGNGEVLYSYGLLLAEMRRYEEAEKMLAQAEEKMPAVARIRYNRAILLGMLNRPVAAEQEFLEALKREPGSAPTLLALADLYLQQGRILEVRSVARELIERYPDDPGVLRLMTWLEGKRDHRKPGGPTGISHE